MVGWAKIQTKSPNQIFPHLCKFRAQISNLVGFMKYVKIVTTITPSPMATLTPATFCCNSSSPCHIYIEWKKERKPKQLSN